MSRSRLHRDETGGDGGPHQKCDLRSDLGVHMALKLGRSFASRL